MSLYGQFFDCLNVRSLNEGKFKRKEFLEPYRNANDERFLLLREEFLGCFHAWLESIAQRNGNFSVADRQKMFISYQCYEGLQITVNSLYQVFA